MNYKIEKMIKDNRKYVIIFVILWLVIDIVLIAPIATTLAGNTKTVIEDTTSINKIEVFISEVTSFTAIFRVFSASTIGIFGKATLYYTIFFVIFAVIGVLKSKPKNEFTDIEHGSSGWCEHGEQYKILSKDKGILLAEKNYLPTNKIGNVNVLIVGRIRFW